VRLVRFHLGIVVTQPVDLSGGPDDVPRANRDTVVAGFAFILVDDYATGFMSLRDQQFSIPLNTAMPKKTSKT
jgi:hypothetical protein